MKLRSTSPNVYCPSGKRLAIGEEFEVEGDTFPRLYRGSAVPADHWINHQDQQQARSLGMTYAAQR